MSVPQLPISNEQAKAVTAFLEIIKGLGGFIQDALGSTPADLVGLLGGDYVRVRRALNMARMMEKARKKLEDRGVKPQPTPLTLSIPLLRDAADESRDELVDLWAELLAAASDPSRLDQVRPEYLEVVKRLAVDDVRVLRHMAPINGILHAQNFDAAAEKLKISTDRFRISLNALTKLELVKSPNTATFVLLPFGREFLRTVGEKDVAQP